MAKRATSGSYPKGMSGNPGGKPKTPAEVVQFARARTLKMMHVLESLAMDPKTEGRVRVSAATAIIDRAYGRPSQAIQLPEDPVDRMSDEQVNALIAKAAALVRNRES